MKIKDILGDNGKIPKKIRVSKLSKIIEKDNEDKVIKEVEIVVKKYKGKDGKDGYTPVKNKDYFDGKDGKDGYTPIKGIDYFDGEDGRDGKDGKDGKDAKSIKGEKGDPGYTPIKGKDYFDGKDGVTKVVTKEKNLSGQDIVEKIEELKGEDRLDVEKLKGLEKIVQWARAGIGTIFSFTELTDTPSSYEGKANNYIKVKDDETGLEFVDRSEVEDYWDIVDDNLVPSESGIDVKIEGDFYASGYIESGANPEIDITYDSNEMVASITKTIDDNELVRDYTYTYNDSGNIGTITKTVDSISYIKTLSYTDDVLTNISAWEEL